MAVLDKKQTKNINTIAIDGAGSSSKTNTPSLEEQLVTKAVNSVLASQPTVAPAIPSTKGNTMAYIGSDGNTAYTPVPTTSKTTTPAPSNVSSVVSDITSTLLNGAKSLVTTKEPTTEKTTTKTVNKSAGTETKTVSKPTGTTDGYQYGDAPVADVMPATADTSSNYIIPYAEYDTSAWTAATQRIQNELDALKSGKTSYTDQMIDAMNAYRNREAFSYDPNSDPLFQSALASAMNSGKLAMQDTMGQAAGLTGGYGSSYATSAANQAYNAFIEGAYDNIADYYNMALNQYNMEGQQLLNTYDMLAQQDSNEWNRAYSSLQTDIDLNNANFTNTLNAYNANRSNYYDAANLNEGIREYDQDFAEDVRRYDQDYAEGVREFDLGYNEGVREFDLGYNEGVREFDAGQELQREKMRQENEQYYAGLEQDASQFGRTEDRLDAQNALDEKMYLAQYGVSSWEELYAALDSGDLVSVGGKLMSADEATSKAAGSSITASQLSSIINDSIKSYQTNGSYDSVLDNSPYADILTDEDLIKIDDAVKSANLPYSMRTYDISLDNKQVTTNQIKTGDNGRDFESAVKVTTDEKIDGKNKKVTMTLAELHTKFIESETKQNITPQTAEEDWNEFKANLMTSLLASGDMVKGWKYTGNPNYAKDQDILSVPFTYYGY